MERAIPFSLENGRIILEAEINGTKGRFMWDSAAHGSFANIQFDNLTPVVEDDDIVNISHLNASIETKKYWLDELIVGGVELKTHSMIVGAPEIIKQKILDVEGVDGILGLTIFEGYWVEISFSRKAIVLHKKKPERYAQSVPAEIVNEEFLCVPVAIDGEEVNFAIDTGMPHSLRFPRSIVRQSEEGGERVLSLDPVKEARFVKTHSITILDERVENKFVLTNSYISAHGLGLIGIGFLQNYDLLLDLATLRDHETTAVYYESIVRPEERRYVPYSWFDKAPESGILTYGALPDGTVILIDIFENSAARTMFGLEPGVVVSKVDGNPARDFFESAGLDETTSEIAVVENGVERIVRRENANP
ncbi:MAG: hypothetical protein LBK73_13590 [Treponema sp.]|jgi:hypothetical protein|nr:hypothetical protein [Treponema sp.]